MSVTAQDFKIANKFGTSCEICGDFVEEKEGFSSKDQTGSWFTTCKKNKCVEEAGIPMEEVRRLHQEPNGHIYIDTPYEPENLDLIRSAPGADFDQKSKKWRVSNDPADRARILEIAEKLDLDVEDGLDEYGVPEHVEARVQDAKEKGAYDYQLEGIEFLALREKALLADDMGLGKTMQAILALPEGSSVLVTCPNSVKYVWADEVEKWRGEDFEVVIPDAGDVPAPSKGEIIVVNYARLPGLLDEDWDGDYDDHGVRLRSDFDALDVVIGDEAHAFKNHEAQRSRRFRELSDTAVRTWLLTGTPLPNRPMDLWGTLGSADMAFDVFGGWKRFLDLFNGRKGRYGGIEFAGTPDPEAGERLRRVMVKRDKEDVLDDLPERTTQEVTVNGLPDDLRDELDALAIEFGEELNDGELPGFEEFSEVRRKLAEQRIPHAIDYAEQYEEAGEPLVIFSAHRKPVEVLGDRDGWTCIHGGVGDEKRADRIARFQDGELDGIALTIGAGKEGITLTEASTMLFVDLPWNPGDLAQAEDRIRRIGQEDQCQYIRLVSDHELDQHITSLLAWKSKVIAKGVDGEVDGEAPEPVELEEIDPEVWANKVAAKEARELDADSRLEVLEVLDWMLARCDGARSEDGAGFNQFDAKKARTIREYVPESSGAARKAAQMLQKYKDTQWGEAFEDIDLPA